ncbi:cbb3-type cytochrome oxidase assembly protein CcoS [Bdellovibrionota bacterium FG-2]
MNIVFILLPFALLLGFGFLAIFIWMVSSGQFDDLETPAYRVLFEDNETRGDEPGDKRA